MNCNMCYSITVSTVQKKNRIFVMNAAGMYTTPSNRFITCSHTPKCQLLDKLCSVVVERMSTGCRGNNK